MLCDTCLPAVTAIFEDAPRSHPYVSNNSSSLKVLQDTAKAGCQICRAVSQCLFNVEPERFEFPKKVLDHEFELRYRRAILHDDESKDASQLLVFGFPKDSKALLKLLPDSPEYDMLALREGCGWYAPLYLSRGSKPFAKCDTLEDCYPVLVQQIRDWLRRTRYGYLDVPIGHRALERPFRPTRLVQISSDATRIAVVETGNLQGKTAYTALSYRWAEQNCFQCMASTFEALKEGISIKKLTKVFQEAVKLTNDIGLMYIWIDALCIIQNDDEDWARESTRMADVYSNADFTIAANARTREHQASFLRPVLASFHRRTMSDHLPYTVSLPPGLLISRSPLTSRGWCLQERLLSKRTLHFVGDDVVFEVCDTAGGSDLIPTSMVPSGLPSPSSASRGARLEDRWYYHVEQYTTRHLAYEKDRLVAISAIASQIVSTTGWRYLHGVWAHDLPEKLLWSRVKRTASNFDIPLDPLSGFPTWSWASCGYPITWRVCMWHSGRSDLVCMSPSEDDTDGTLRVYGQLLPATFSRIDDTAHDRERETAFSFETDDSGLLNQILTQERNQSGEQPPSGYYYDFVPDSPSLDSMSTSCYFLPIQRHSHQYTDQKDSRHQVEMLGLVLRRRDETTDDYIRIGFAHTRHYIDIPHDKEVWAQFVERVAKCELRRGQWINLV